MDYKKSIIFARFTPSKTAYSRLVMIRLLTLIGLTLLLSCVTMPNRPLRYFMKKTTWERMSFPAGIPASAPTRLPLHSLN